MPSRLLAALGLLAAAAAAGACGGGDETPPAASPPSGPPPAVTTAEEPPPPATTETSPDDPRESLPAPVAERADAIGSAAARLDYDALAAMVDLETFSYSFGEGGDPAGYWQRLEEDGVPVLSETLPALLSTRAAFRDGVYMWPEAFTKLPAEWSEDDLADLRTLYSEKEIEDFRDAGLYLGWRLGIREDGRWLFFVEGD